MERFRLIVCVSILLSGCRSITAPQPASYSVVQPQPISYVVQPCEPQPISYFAQPYVPSYWSACEPDYSFCKSPWLTVDRSRAVAETGTYGQAPDATNAGDSLPASSIPGIQGVNPRNLLNVLEAALADDTVNLTAAQPIMLADRVVINTTSQPIAGVNYTHRIIAMVVPGSEGVEDKIALRVYSSPEDGSIAPQHIPANIFKNIVRVISPSTVLDD